MRGRTLILLLLAKAAVLFVAFQRQMPWIVIAIIGDLLAITMAALPVLVVALIPARLVQRLVPDWALPRLAAGGRAGDGLALALPGHEAPRLAMVAVAEFLVLSLWLGILGAGLIARPFISARKTL